MKTKQPSFGLLDFKFAGAIFAIIATLLVLSFYIGKAFFYATH